jgi:hypothetical protein
MGYMKDKYAPGDAETGWPPDEELTEGQLADKWADVADYEGDEDDEDDKQRMAFRASCGHWDSIEIDSSDPDRVALATIRPCRRCRATIRRPGSH